MSDNKIKYPVGIQTFSEIIEEGQLYVDKTALMYKLVKDVKYAFLSRPRRFGKSLLMSTIECYFQGKKHLFKGLALEKLECDWEEYPVFRFDLSSEDSLNDPAGMERQIADCLDAIEENYGVSTEGNINSRFKSLFRQVNRLTGKRVVVLIDEYDKPMLNTLHDDQRLELVRAKLRSFYSVIKEYDRYVKFCMITGVSKFSKVSIFSGFNNLFDISMLSDYNAICGISESEFKRDFATSIERFARLKGWSVAETWEKFKAHYDGYLFAKEGEGIYNPYSVLSAFKSKDIGHYWFSSGTSSYLPRLICQNSFNLRSLEDARRKEGALADVADPDSDIVPMLYQAGYLTLRHYDSATQEYTLEFPNEEVAEGFWDSLSRFFFRKNGNYVFDQKMFVDDLYSGNPDAFMTRLRSLLADTPLHPRTDKEVYFQNVLLTVGKMLGMQVSTEVHSAHGRCDMIITTRQYLYIFEFKIDRTPEEALKQILDKGYHLPYEADPRIKFLIGANFSTKERILSGWDIRTL